MGRYKVLAKDAEGYTALDHAHPKPKPKPKPHPAQVHRA